MYGDMEEVVRIYIRKEMIQVLYDEEILLRRELERVRRLFSELEELLEEF
ncbi:MAG: hypothetical protein J7J79_02000 [Thermoplasmata archaeon]|nr:hypothetical protein [Thermoplasmata archaeon]